MNKHNVKRTPSPAQADNATTIPAPSRDVLSAILRNGAQQLLAQAVNAKLPGSLEPRHPPEMQPNSDAACGK